MDFRRWMILAVVLASGVVVTPLHAADDPFFATYKQSVGRMSQPDETFATVALNSTQGSGLLPLLAASKTCSQRCSTSCSVSCTTTRGCSSNCKRQTDGCGGSGSGSYSGTTKQGAVSRADEDVVDINSATTTELMELPGIGSAEARDIIAGRPWRRKDDIVKKGILTQSRFDRVKAWLIAKQ